MFKYHLRLHFVIWLSSLVPLVVNQIDLSATELVFYRTLMAVAFLAIWLVAIKKFKWAGKKTYFLMGTGILTFIYWTLIVVSTKLSNEAVCLIGLATIPLFVSILRPILGKGKLSVGEIITGLNAIFGIYIIYSSDFDYGLGFFLALLGAFFGALVTIFNADLVKEEAPLLITFYQMGGASLTAFLLLLFSTFFGGVVADFIPVKWSMTWNSFLLIFGLALGVSVYAYSESVRLMKYLNPFTVAMVGNLVPLYGILSVIVLSYFVAKVEVTPMDIYFYAGGIIVVAAVVARPLVTWYFEVYAKDDEKSSVMKK
ncbi:DMT family transporter [Bernardetia sp.]|uniref:DMT family transporter n=1 Tax=Bernardetia sp. TaxID=1937974 RepID=UPI0025B9E7A7|nr:DMT family transporter [Bernardetia sp.]